MPTECKTQSLLDSGLGKNSSYKRQEKMDVPAQAERVHHLFPFFLSYSGPQRIG